VNNRKAPSVVLVGRPNVGKSTLFNRMAGSRRAIVAPLAGTTRDSLERPVVWRGAPFQLFDTGGMYGASEDPLHDLVARQGRRAIEGADLVVIVADGREGLVGGDETIARELRETGKPLLVAVNKIDDKRARDSSMEFYQLGIDPVLEISAEHGTGVAELLDAIVDRLGAGGLRLEAKGEDAEVRPASSPQPLAASLQPLASRETTVAIVGRPNVGKSSLVNRLLHAERVLVSDMPGTTRDAIDTVVETDEGPLRFVDTAGLRRKSQIDEPSEYYSLVRALEAIDRADAALFLIDASEGVTNQDQRLAERVDAAGSAVVLVLNKWDLLDAEQRAKVREQVADKLGFISYAPALPISALTGKRLHQLLPALRDAEVSYHARVPTGVLNRVLRDAQAEHPPPMQRRHRPRVLYATQGASDPPTFTLFATRSLSPQYLRYLERKLRESFDLGPTPVKLRVRLRNE
jgi:GTP-binding protein